MKNSAKNKFLAIVFPTVVVLPLVQSFTGLFPEGSLAENRRRTGFPDTFPARKREVRPYIGKIESWWNDNFGFRSLMISTNSAYRLAAFGSAPNPRVVIGKEGWLYLGNIGDRELDMVTGHFSLNDADVGTWKTTLEHRHIWCEEHGISYRFFLGPNKSTIYPELHPQGRHLERPARVGRDLMKTIGLPALDLATSLEKEKENKPTYFREDTHWNDWGGFVAYQDIMKSVALDKAMSDVIPLRPDNVRFEPSAHVGDLRGMLGMSDAKAETYEKATPQLGKDPSGAPPERKETAPDNTPGQSLEIRNSFALNANARVFFSHDSFGYALRPWLTATFGHAHFQHLWPDALPVKELRMTRPQLVLQEIVERGVSSFKPAIDPGLAAFAKRARAFRSREQKVIAKVEIADAEMGSLSIIHNQARCNEGNCVVRLVLEVTQECTLEGTEAVAVTPGRNVIFLEWPRAGSAKTLSTFTLRGCRGDKGISKTLSNAQAEIRL